MNTLPRSTILQSLRQSLSAHPVQQRYASTAASTPTRVYTERKAILYQSYNHILDVSPAILLFQPNNLTMAELGKIRRAIAGIPATSFEHNATLTVVRTGILSAVVNNRKNFQSAEALGSLLSGPLALVTCPNFSPTHIGKILQAINKALGQRPPVATQGSFPVNARLMLLGGVFERNTVVSAQEVADIAKLPELSTLHAQLVGLLESSGSQLVGTLQSAAGGSLIRTLKGLENNLKGPEQTDEA
ncbi:hypothetical protein QFC20_001422 [Naganishia adeliensis]|uniref:Uncharacterized protein n=1 Tax=Naganishia adeliensis TaxID=92952 RepID=A0ACC2WRY4_9TREE|nr:hypothetical protein QFC20_001422 [Naganishia adeliensis]